MLYSPDEAFHEQNLDNSTFFKQIDEVLFVNKLDHNKTRLTISSDVV